MLISWTTAFLILCHVPRCCFRILARLISTRCKSRAFRSIRLSSPVSCVPRTMWRNCVHATVMPPRTRVISMVQPLMYVTTGIRPCRRQAILGVRCATTPWNGCSARCCVTCDRPTAAWWSTRWIRDASILRWINEVELLASYHEVVRAGLHNLPINDDFQYRMWVEKEIFAAFHCHFRKYA